MTVKTDDITRGGQLALLRFRMFMQVNNVLFYYLVLLWIAVTSLVIYFRLDTEIFHNGVQYWWARSLVSFTQIMRSPPVFSLWYQGHSYTFTWEKMLTDPYAVWCGTKLIDEVLNCLLVTSLVMGAAYALIFFCLGKVGRGQSRDEVLGGRTFEPVRVVARMLRRRDEASDMVIDGLPMKKDAEIQNFALHGTVGTGKSTLLEKKLDHIARRKQPAIIYDKGCTVVEKFYDPARGDIILNPLDKRCPFWDMWGECLNLPDFESMTETLIPMGNAADPFWQGSARTIFAEGAERMRGDTERSYNKFLRTLLSVGLDKLRAFLEGTPAATLVDGSIEKTAISIRSVLTNYVKSMRYLQGTDGPDRPRFTIREWMQENADKQRPAWLFITSSERYHESLKPLISMWLGIAATNLLSLDPSRRRRIWFLYDEIPTLHKLPSLPRVLAEGRKFGGCFVLGFQNYAQMEEAYGKDFARAIYDLLNTKFFFRSPSAEVAKHVATDLGETIRRRFSEQTSFGSEQVRDGISYGKDEERVLIKSYSDIQKLNDLECFVTLPGDYPVTRLKLKFCRRPVVADALVERDFITSLDPDIEMQLVAIESEERKAVQGLFDDVAVARPQQAHNAASALFATGGDKSAPAKKAPKEIIDRETGEVLTGREKTSGSLDVSMPMVAPVRRTDEDDAHDDEDDPGTGIAGGGRENEIPITRGPVTLSPEAGAPDAHADYEQYAQSAAQEAMYREEREFIPASGHEPEM
jgi:type IV conjugative transfer system coupling protein TraD